MTFGTITAILGFGGIVLGRYSAQLEQEALWLLGLLLLIGRGAATHSSGCWLRFT